MSVIPFLAIPKLVRIAGEIDDLQKELLRIKQKNELHYMEVMQRGTHNSRFKNYMKAKEVAAHKENDLRDTKQAIITMSFVNLLAVGLIVLIALLGE